MHSVHCDSFLVQSGSSQLLSISHYLCENNVNRMISIFKFMESPIFIHILLCGELPYATYYFLMPYVIIRSFDTI